MDDKQFKQLESKLDIITKLLALNILQGKSPKEQIATLAAAGLKTGEIASLTGKSVVQVSVTLNRIKKAKNKQAGEEEDLPVASPSGETTNV